MKHAHIVTALAILVGCGQKAGKETAPPPAQAATGGATTEAEADRTATLNRLTQVLRKFSAEHQRVPKSLDELVTAGYLSELPAAPPGKKYVFDDQLRVRIE